MNVLGGLILSIALAVDNKEEEAVVGAIIIDYGIGSLIAAHFFAFLKEVFII